MHFLEKEINEIYILNFNVAYAQTKKAAMQRR